MNPFPPHAGGSRYQNAARRAEEGSMASDPRAPAAGWPGYPPIRRQHRPAPERAPRSGGGDAPEEP